MKYFRILFVVFYILPIHASAEPPNLSLIKNEIVNYHDSGAYERELTRAIKQAHDYILNQVAANSQRQPKKQLAVVLDVDETSLSNYEKIAHRNFVGTQSAIHKEIMAANSVPIKPMLSLYNDALKGGVKIFFVTGRNQSECQATEKNLRNAGYKNWAGLYCKPNNYNLPSIVRFKAKTRAFIAKQGYTVIATIGDQYSDLIGGFARKEFKLPNPFYYLP